MGVLDKFLDVMRLNPEDEEDGFYEDDYYDEEDEPVSRKSTRKDRKNTEYDDVPSVREKPKAAPKITPMRSVKKQGVGGMEV